uniref:ADF-H domain-containing protein n=1 Tax=Oryza brachyantha TaxID=4533 RepID=J3N469_ORYBR
MEILGFSVMVGGGSPAWVEVPEKSKSAFLELKRRKVHRYVIFKIDDRREEIVVEKTGAPGESYADFTASLPADDCRYAVYDLDFVSDDNCRKSKIFFISWSPSVSGIRAKTIYAVSRNQFRHELDGVHFEIQATDPDDMDLDVLRGRANRT